MHCPFCKHHETKVIDKRDNTDTNVTRRRRECEKCLKRFTTYERIETLNLYVIKKSGTLEEFDRNKLRHSLTIALVNTDVNEELIEEAVQEIEQQLLNYESTQIASREIGEIVLEKLKEIDPLGYVRYASVYNAFKNLDDFKKAIAGLEKESKK